MGRPGDGWQSNRGSSNGSTYLGAYSSNAGAPPTFTLAALDASPFRLVSIDLGELFRPGDFAFAGVARTVALTGQLLGGGTITTSFNLDLISNGFGPPNDFQTLSFSGGWSNLTSVSISALNQSNIYGTWLAFDNIQVEPVPEPGTLLLLGSGMSARKVSWSRDSSGRHENGVPATHETERPTATCGDPDGAPARSGRRRATAMFPAPALCRG